MLDRLAPIAHEDKETFCKAVRRLIVDHRTHERRGLAVRFANDQPVSDLLHLAQQCIIEAVLDDQPLGCRTALASRHERSEERRVGKECGSTCRSRWWQSH